MVDEIGIDEDLVWGAEGLIVLEEEVGRDLGPVGRLAMAG